MVEANLHTLSPEAVSALVKRHTHDLRNFLNGLEMELALLTETVDAAEKSASLKRIREEMRCAETMLRLFGAKFIVENKSSICVSDVAEQWMSDARCLLPGCSITWDIKGGGTLLQAQAAALRSVLSDLLVFTARKRPGDALEARCSSENNRVVFSVSCASAIKDDSHGDPADELLWLSLQNLGARSGGLLETVTSPSEGRCACRLIFEP